MFEHLANTTFRTARRIAIAIIGATVVAVGIAMLVLPGPGLVVIGVGLAFLSIEFAFAHRWLRYVRERSEQAADSAGIPKALRRAVVIAGLGLSLVLMVLPGVFAIVRSPEGWHLVRRQGFSYAHTWTTIEQLERARSEGDESAATLLESVHRRRPPAAPEEEPR